MSVTGPAPNLRGDTETRSGLIDALTTIGTAGRGLLAYSSSSPPQPAATRTIPVATATALDARTCRKMLAIARVSRGGTRGPAGTLHRLAVVGGSRDAEGS